MWALKKVYYQKVQYITQILRFLIFGVNKNFNHTYIEKAFCKIYIYVYNIDYLLEIQ